MRDSISFRIHSWLGLKLSLLLLLVVASGTLATVSHEIEWLIDSRVRAEPVGERATLSEIAALVADRYPEARIRTISMGPQASFESFATEVRIAWPDGKSRAVYVDPWQRRITGERVGHSYQSFLRQFHNELFVWPYGFVLNCSFGALLLGALITGLMTYPKFWRGFLRPPKLTWGPRMFWPALHRWLGLWSSVFVLIVAATTLWFLTREMLYWTGVAWFPPAVKLSEADIASRPAGAQPLSLDDLVAAAVAAVPTFRPQIVYLPRDEKGTVALWGQTDSPIAEDRANQVQLDPYTGRVLRALQAKNAPTLRRLVHAATPMHYGTFGGLATKLLWLLFGLALCTMIASGAIVYARRAIGPHALNWMLGWLGRWRWVNLAILAMVLVATIRAIAT